MSKLAPANQDGLKPYAVRVWCFGRVTTTVHYAEGPRSAGYMALGRPGPGEYIKSSRRATNEDMKDA